MKLLIKGNKRSVSHALQYLVILKGEKTTLYEDLKGRKGIVLDFRKKENNKNGI